MKSRKTIVFDFDGVIHTGYIGYKDDSIYGEIDNKILDFMEELLKSYYVVISSNRPAKQIVEFMNNYTNKLKFEEFDKSCNNLFWNKSSVIGVTNEKAIGILYIDDRGFRYNPNDVDQNIKEIKQLLSSMHEV